ncbi:MAG: hypothetical protein HZA50_14295 [Planctomycetes bacterium]|nr:hypothetical protein [Planctomycetota bacterium]
MAKNTPGPWIVEEFHPNKLSTRLRIVHATGAECGISTSEVVCCDVGDKNSDTARANANLMAAAPDLLEVCKSALATLDNIGSADRKVVRIAIRAAIAKAEGAGPGL